MTEKIIVSPERVRAYGDVVSPKSSQDFVPYGCTVSSSTDSTYGTVFTEAYLAKSTLSLVYDRWISSETESFTISATLKNSSGSAISSASVFLVVNDGSPVSATTNSSGVATFTVSTSTDVSDYRFRVYYTGTGSVCGSTVYGHVCVGDVTGLELHGNKSVIQTDESVGLWASLTGAGCLKGVPVSFYEQWTPVLRVGANPSIIQTGDTMDLSAQLCDSDGSLIRESGHNITFGVEQDTITMFNGTETFTRVGTGTGTLNISYSQDNELVYTAGSGILFHSDVVFQVRHLADWECEFKFKATGIDGGRFGIYRASSTESEKELIALKCQLNKVYLDTQTGTESMTESMIATGYSSYQTLKVIAQDDNAKIYLDGTLKTQVTLDWLAEPLCFGLNGWTTGNVIYVKDFSFKESE